MLHPRPLDIRCGRESYPDSRTSVCKHENGPGARRPDLAWIGPPDPWEQAVFSMIV